MSFDVLSDRMQGQMAYHVTVGFRGAVQVQSEQVRAGSHGAVRLSEDEDAATVVFELPGASHTATLAANHDADKPFQWLRRPAVTQELGWPRDEWSAVVAETLKFASPFTSLRLMRLVPERLRMPVEFVASGNAATMASDGSGLAGVLASIWLRDPAARERILRATRDALPHVLDVLVEPRNVYVSDHAASLSQPKSSHRAAPGFEIVVVTHGGTRVPSTQLSDGVLLFLGCAVLALGSNPAPLIMLEEPDSGLHPGLLDRVVGLLRRLTETSVDGIRTQVIVTTHSPLLLNHVQPEEIRVVERTKELGTKVRAFDSIPDLKRLLELEGPGEIWINRGEENLFKAAS